MTFEEIEEAKKRTVDNITEAVEEIETIATRELQGEISYSANMEDMVGDLERAVSTLEHHIESLRRCKGKLIDLVDLQNG